MDLEVVAAEGVRGELGEQVDVVALQHDAAQPDLQLRAQLPDRGGVRAGQQRARAGAQRVGGAAGAERAADRLEVGVDDRVEPVRAGAQHIGADEAAQPQDLAAHRRRVALLAVEHERELLGGEPVRVQREHGEQLGGAERQRDRPAVEDGRGRALAGEAQRQRRARLGGRAAVRRAQQVALRELLDDHLAAVVEHHPVDAGLHGHPLRPHPVRLARHDPAGGGDQRAGLATEAREVGHVAQAQPLVLEGETHPQLVLGELGGGRDQLLHRRVHRVQGARDVDGAQDRAGVRVVHRRGGAGPRVVGAHQVLGRVDRDRRVHGERGAHRVGADGVLGPTGARDQAHLVGRAEHRRGALAPQDQAVGVGDDHDVHRLVGDAHERAAQQRHHRVERVRLPQGRDVLLAEDDGRRAPVRVDVGGEAALPRLGHEGARRDGCPVAGEHGLEHLLHQAGVGRGVEHSIGGHLYSERHRPRTRPSSPSGARAASAPDVARATYRQRHPS